MFSKFSIKNIALICSGVNAIKVQGIKEDVEKLNTALAEAEELIHKHGVFLITFQF